jgi:phage/plasmid-like protein (TIGR03299 family)
LHKIICICWCKALTNTANWKPKTSNKKGKTKMAHMIENNMIAYKNETPWHGLGFRVDPNATGAEMLQAAGMAWRVNRRALAMRAMDGTTLLAEPLKDFKAIVRSDNDHVFCIPTAKYNVVQNEAIVELFREYCEAGHASMETIGGIRNGAVVWALAKLNGGSEATLKGGDKLTGYVLMSTSHDGSLSTTGKATQVRVVCQNTLSAALTGKADFRMKHSAKWTPEKADEAKASLGMAMQQIQKMNKVAETLSNVNIDHSDWLSFMGKLMGGEENVIDTKSASLTRMAADIQEATISSPGSNLESAKGTLWGAVNGITYYTDHQRGRTQDTRLASAWFGDSDLLKRTAVNVALEMAGVTV